MPRKRKGSKSGMNLDTMETKSTGSGISRARNMVSKATRAPGAPRPGRLEGTSLALPVIGNVGQTAVPSVPPPNLYQTATGRVHSTEVMRDRFMPSKPAVFQPMYHVILGDNAAYFQGQNAASPLLALGQVLGGTLSNLYPMIVRSIMIDGGIAMRDTTLKNTASTTGPDSLTIWLSQYIAAFTLIRAAQGALAIGNFNYPCSLIADAANQNIFKIESALRRLRTFAIPPMWIEWIDRLCGPKVWSEDDPVIFPTLANGSPPSLAVNDLTSANTWAAMLNNSESFMTNLATGGGVMDPADAQAICNTFALAYGTPNLPIDKAVEQDPGTYVMWQSGVYNFHDSTATKIYEWPNMNPNASIPLYIPRGYSGPALKQMQSLLRAGVFSTAPVTGVASGGGGGPASSEVGILGSQIFDNNHGTNAMLYLQDSTKFLLTADNAGPVTYGYNSAVLEMAVWSGEAGLEATDFTNDARTFRGIDRVYVTSEDLINETNYMLQACFLEPLRGSTPKTY